MWSPEASSPLAFHQTSKHRCGMTSGYEVHSGGMRALLQSSWDTDWNQNSCQARATDGSVTAPDNHLQMRLSLLGSTEFTCIASNTFAYFLIISPVDTFPPVTAAIWSNYSLMMQFWTGFNRLSTGFVVKWRRQMDTHTQSAVKGVKGSLYQALSLTSSDLLIAQLVIVNGAEHKACLLVTKWL